MTPLRRMVVRIMLTPSIAVTSAAALLVAGILVGLYEEQLYRLQKVREITVQAQILAASATAALVFNDMQAAQEYIESLRVNPEIESAAIYDVRNRSIAGFVRQGGSPLPQQPPGVAPYFENDRVIAEVPVIQNGMHVGTVYLRARVDSLQRQLVRYGGIILLVTMAMLLLIVLGTAHRELALANIALTAQAGELAQANARLKEEAAEREKAEEALRQSQKMEAIGQLSGGIAHDFNNLITIVKGNLQLLARRIAQGRTDVQRYIDAALEGLNRAASLTQRILAFSRRQPLSPKPVSLSRLIADMRELVRHSVGETIEIETRLNAQWWTLCDANQMESVILNLAINARDAMPNGGKLTIETSDVEMRPGDGQTIAGDYVRLSVRDTGTGMSEEVRRKAIDPFFTTKPQGHGTGLGLSMTFGYVQQSNGYLEIDSKLGQGTTITILMPRHNAATIPISA